MSIKPRLEILTSAPRGLSKNVGHMAIDPSGGVHPRMADLCLADPLVDRFCWLRCICNSMGNGCSGRYETFMTNRQWCWNDAFKFARWQHCAVELWARFAMHSTTCEEVFTKCMRLHYLYSLLSIGGLWRQTVGDDCSEFHPSIFFSFGVHLLLPPSPTTWRRRGPRNSGELGPDPQNYNFIMPLLPHSGLAIITTLRISNYGLLSSFGTFSANC